MRDEARNNMIDTLVLAINPFEIVVCIKFFLYLYRSLYPRRTVPNRTLTSPINIAMYYYCGVTSYVFAFRRKIYAANGAATLISFEP